MSNDKSTPRPWHIDGQFIRSYTEDGVPTIAEVLTSPSDSTSQDAELIVRAVNSHDALVEALEKTTESLSNVLEGQMGGYSGGWVDAFREYVVEARAVLALAKGE